MDKKFNRNGEIRATQVMLVSDGAKPEVMTLNQALDLAYEQDLDLVEINPNQDPPVCKVMDYGAFLYKEAKRQHENQKNSREQEVKEIRLRPVTDEGDVKTKVRQIQKFLEEGHKVRMVMRFKGREITFNKLGFELIERMQQLVGEVAKVEANPKMEGRQIVCILAPEAKVAKLDKKADKSESKADKPTPVIKIKASREAKELAQTQETAPQQTADVVAENVAVVKAPKP